MRVLMITGAGISASSGLPTYRGENGLYGKLEAAAGMPIEKLLSPQALADDPEKVWEHWRDLSVQIHTSAPTPTHKAMTDLSDHYRRGKSDNFSPSVHKILHFELVSGNFFAMDGSRNINIPRIMPLNIMAPR